MKSAAFEGRRMEKKESTMPFVSHSGLPGEVFVPIFKPERSRKHPCRDYFSCQQCGEDRCHVCRGETEKETENSSEGDRCVNQ